MTVPLRDEKPLTVVMVASGFTAWGGMELHLLNLGVQLRDRGHRVWIAAQPGHWVQQKALSLGLPVFEATLRGQQDWSDFWCYLDFFRRERVDVVHTHTIWDLLIPALAARLARVPVVVTTWHLPKPFRTPAGGRLLLRFYDRMIAVSHSVREMHLRNGVAPDKVKVIYHGTDVAAFQSVTRGRDAMRAELGIPEGSVAVGIVGRVSPEKGHSVLLSAARQLGNRIPICYVVVGDGPDEGALREQVREAGLTAQVLFAGFRDDVNAVMQALDVLVVPSLWEEPCAAVVQQAMAVSLPVVGTRTGGTPEMVQDGQTGLLVPPGDAAALADALERLAGDAPMRARLGAAGLARVEAKFSLRMMTDEVESLYRHEYQSARGAQALFAKRCPGANLL